ncbi:unnamed protein product, partial [Closterium sp. NIES-53]
STANSSFHPSLFLPLSRSLHYSSLPFPPPVPQQPPPAWHLHQALTVDCQSLFPTPLLLSLPRSYCAIPPSSAPAAPSRMAPAPGADSRLPVPLPNPPPAFTPSLLLCHSPLQCPSSPLLLCHSPLQCPSNPLPHGTCTRHSPSTVNSSSQRPGRKSSSGAAPSPTPPSPSPPPFPTSKTLPLPSQLWRQAGKVR